MATGRNLAGDAGRGGTEAMRRDVNWASNSSGDICTTALVTVSSDMNIFEGILIFCTSVVT